MTILMNGHVVVTRRVPIIVFSNHALDRLYPNCPDVARHAFQRRFLCINQTWSGWPFFPLQPLESEEEYLARLLQEFAIDDE